jgi:hypothetical protein
MLGFVSLKGIAIKNPAFSSSLTICVVKEGSRILYEGKIRCQNIACFDPYSTKCSGDPVSRLVFDEPVKSQKSCHFREGGSPDLSNITGFTPSRK